jgi:hypothetical protein
MLNDTAVSQAFLEQQSLAHHLFNGGTWISRQDGIVITSTLASAKIVPAAGWYVATSPRPT